MRFITFILLSVERIAAIVKCVCTGTVGSSPASEPGLRTIRREDGEKWQGETEVPSAQRLLQTAWMYYHHLALRRFLPLY